MDEKNHELSVRVAVLIPCLNEEASIGAVILGFRKALPEARIYVFDNGSDDRTSEIAREAGAEVGREPRRGKGNVVGRMFADTEADIYVLVDGDGTYHAASAPLMINQLLECGLDMVTGVRRSEAEAAFRRGHRFGNVLMTNLVGHVFGRQCSDMLSGYRVLSRRFVKTFPALSSGFEVETELTVHALELRMPMAEVITPYFERAAASSSKLRTFGDGFRILRTIARLVRDERPLECFFGLWALLAIASLIAGWPVVMEFMATGLVPRLPSAVLSVGLMVLAFLSLVCGMILDVVTKGRLEARRLAYLREPAPRSRRRAHRDVLLGELK